MAQKFKTAISVEELAAASSQAVGVKVDGDSEARVKIDAGGKITWGSGSAAGDARTEAFSYTHIRAHET